MSLTTCYTHIISDMDDQTLMKPITQVTDASLVISLLMCHLNSVWHLEQEQYDLSYYYTPVV